MEEEYEVAEKIESEYKCKIIKNEYSPYILYLATDIGKIINLKNVHRSIINYDINLKIKLKQQTKGGEQYMSFLTYEGLKKILVSSRTTDAIYFAEKIGMDIYRNKFTAIESDTIDCIIKAFSGYETIKQYQILGYRIDLYFVDYKIAVECDEYNHKYQLENDKKREEIIKEKLCCDFIRYNPDDKNFNIFLVINEIMRKINIL